MRLEKLRVGKSRNTEWKEGTAAVMIGLGGEKARWKEFGR